MYKEKSYNGTIRLKNEATIQRWKDLGLYQEQINRGYIFNKGCGRFRLDKCNCTKCTKTEKND